MNRWTLVGILLATVVAVGAGAVGADGSTPVTARPAAQVQPPNPHPVPQARSGAMSAVDSAVESKFTPIAPCRIVDTRLAGGRIGSLQARSFNALGGGYFGGQGGASCDIPASATAISASVLTVNPSAPGYLRIWSYGTPEPLASFTNYSRGGIVGKSGEIQVASAGRDFTVRSVGGSTDVVIDVTGYYISPTWAEVEFDASLIRGSRVVSQTHIGTGYYQVDFDRNVSNCSYAATSFYYGHEMTVEPRSGDSHGVFVAVTNYNGTGVDTRFYLTVTC
jgi:hypothetical protein